MQQFICLLSIFSAGTEDLVVKKMKVFVLLEFTFY